MIIDVLMVAFIIIFAAALIGGFIWEYRQVRYALKYWRLRRRFRARNPVSLGRRLRYPYRLAWYRLTKRMPRYKGLPRDGGRRMTQAELVELQAIGVWLRKRGVWAEEPDYSKEDKL